MDPPVVTARQRKSKLVDDNRTTSSRSCLPEESRRNALKEDKRQPQEPVTASSPCVRTSYGNFDASNHHDSSVYDLIGTHSDGSSSESLTDVEPMKDRQLAVGRRNTAKRSDRNEESLALSSKTLPAKTIQTNGRESPGDPREQMGSHRATAKQSKQNTKTKTSASAFNDKQLRSLIRFNHDVENEENLPEPLPSVEKQRAAVRQKGGRGARTRSKPEKRSVSSTVVEKKQQAVDVAAADVVMNKSEEAAGVMARDHRDAKKPRKKNTKGSAPAVVEATRTLADCASSQDVETADVTMQPVADGNADHSAGQKQSSGSMATDMLTQGKKPKSSKLPELSQKDVEPDSPIKPVKRRKSSPSSLAAKTIGANDDASRRAPQTTGHDGSQRVKKSRDRMRQLTAGHYQKKTVKTVGSRKKSTDGELASVSVYLSVVRSLGFYLRLR